METRLHKVPNIPERLLYRLRLPQPVCQEWLREWTRPVGIGHEITSIRQRMALPTCAFKVNEMSEAHYIYQFLFGSLRR
jgi:hypothetical protein